MTPDPSARRQPQFDVQCNLNFTSNSTSIIRPIRSQLYVQFDINFTSNSTSIIHPIRPQFYVQFDLNFTSNSTSILRPIRSPWDTFFLPTGRSWGDMKLPPATIVIGMNFIPRPLAIEMKSSQWIEVGCPIGMRLWMNQWG